MRRVAAVIAVRASVSLTSGSGTAWVISINTPTCAVGTIRGMVSVPLATNWEGYDHAKPVACDSTLENPIDDVQAFFNGFVPVSPTPLQPFASG